MSLVTIPLIGYASDLDPTMPGVFSYSKGMVATERGWRMRWHPSTIATATLGSTDYLLDGAVGNITDGTIVGHFARYDVSASKVKLYRLNGSSLSDASRGSNYALSGINWTFCNYGNYQLACYLSEPVQIRDASGSGAFADSAATGIPKAAICVTWGPPTSPRVMLLNYNDGTAYYDGWWTSHQGGPTAAWTVDVATGAVNGRLLGAGTLTCAVAFGDDVIAWSDTQMWYGKFVGPPFICEWRRLSDRIGCVGPYAATVINNVAYWVSERGLFQFSSGGLQKVAAPIQNDIVTRLNIGNAVTNTLRSTQVVSDRTGQYLYVVFRPSAIDSNTKINTYAIGINLANNKVGVLTDGQRLWMGRGYSLIIDNADGGSTGGTTLYREITDEHYHAVANDSYGFGLNYIGSNKGDTRLLDVIPRFITAPYSYTMTDYFGPTLSEATTAATAVSVTATPWRANITKSARWHAPRFAFVNYSGAIYNMEVADVLLNVEKSGNQ